MSQKHGSIDETARPFTEQERKIAEVLAAEGKHVIALLEDSTDEGRKPDAEIKDDPAQPGLLVEFKSLDPGATPARVRNVVNNSIRNGGQARNIIIDARGSGLTSESAREGLNRTRNITRGKVDSVRVIGDDYDITETDFA